jgi:hypothetical protein
MQYIWVKNDFFRNIGFMGIKRRRILCRFQKYKLVLVTKCTQNELIKIKDLLLLHRRPPCVVKHKLYPGFTRFRGILALIQVYIFEIYTKFCVFWYPSWGGLKKKFFGPLLCAGALFEAAPGRPHAINKNFFAGFPFFTSKWNYCRVTGPQNKIFIKNQLTLVYC